MSDETLHALEEINRTLKVTNRLLSKLVLDKTYGGFDVHTLKNSSILIKKAYQADKTK